MLAGSDLHRYLLATARLSKLMHAEPRAAVHRAERALRNASCVVSDAARGVAALDWARLKQLALEWVGAHMCACQRSGGKNP